MQGVSLARRLLHLALSTWVVGRHREFSWSVENHHITQTIASNFAEEDVRFTRFNCSCRTQRRFAPSQMSRVISRIFLLNAAAQKFEATGDVVKAREAYILAADAFLRYAHTRTRMILLDAFIVCAALAHNQALEQLVASELRLTKNAESPLFFFFL